MTMKAMEVSKRREFIIKGTVGALIPLISPIHGFIPQVKSVNTGRRIVTGVDDSGKSVIQSDGIVPDFARWSEKTGNGSDLWVEPQVPVDLSKCNDLDGRTGETEPPDGGVIIRIGTGNPGWSYPMHKTTTLDFCIVISGQIELILDEGSTVVKPGDTVIQRGTNHGWRVVGDEPCTMVAVLLSGVKK
jgi:quercetin dioxygenase-like cupin family protein